MMSGLLTLIGDRRNVAGLVGATAGLGLTFGGVIDAGWWAITGGLYAAGFLGTQILAPPKRVAGPLWQAAPVAALPADLRAILVGFEIESLPLPPDVPSSVAPVCLF